MATSFFKGIEIDSPTKTINENETSNYQKIKEKKHKPFTSKPRRKIKKIKKNFS